MSEVAQRIWMQFFVSCYVSAYFLDSVDLYLGSRDSSSKTSKMVKISPKIAKETKIFNDEYLREIFKNFENTKNGRRPSNQPIQTKFIRFQVVLLFSMVYNFKKPNFYFEATRRNSSK
jgi:hypothetical protein